MKRVTGPQLLNKTSAWRPSLVNLTSIDALDAGFCTGTRHPVLGGLTSRRRDHDADLRINIVGGDIVEVVSAVDTTGATADCTGPMWATEKSYVCWDGTCCRPSRKITTGGAFCAGGRSAGV